MPARNLPKPVPGPVTSPYGPRVIGGAYSFHSGFDLAWLYRDPVGSKRVLAPLDGVALVGRNDLIGNFVSLPIGDGYSTRLCHLESVAVRSGQGVRRGDFLGVMGATGTQAVGEHLHVDVFAPDGSRVNPADYYSDTYVGSLAPASGGAVPFPTTPTESDDDMSSPRIIAPFGLDDRAVVGGGLAYVFPNPGELAHFRNFERAKTPSIDETVVVGDAAMSTAARKAVFDTLVRIHQSDQGVANDVAGIPGRVEAALADELAAITSGGADLAPLLAAINAQPDAFVAKLKAAL